MFHLIFVYSLRSTNIKRTIETVRSIVAGLYGKENLTTPITIHSLNDEEEYLFPNPSCEVLRFLAHRDWMKLESSSSQLAKDKNFFENLLGIDKSKHHVNFVHLRDDLACRITHGHEVPGFLKDHYKTIDKHAVTVFVYQCAGFHGTDSDLMLRLIVGPILRKFRNYMEEAIAGKKTHKLGIYGAHDSTLVPLLVALGGFDYKWPPFLADVTFELYSNEEAKHSKDYFVKVLYNQKPLKIPGCPSEMCRFDDFWKALKKYEMPTATLPADECAHEEHLQRLKKEYQRDQDMDEEEGESERPAGM